PSVRGRTLGGEGVGDSGESVYLDRIRQISFRALKREPHLVASRGQLGDERCVLPQVELRSTCEEQDPQATPGAHRRNDSVAPGTRAREDLRPGAAAKSVQHTPRRGLRASGPQLLPGL